MQAGPQLKWREKPVRPVRLPKLSSENKYVQQGSPLKIERELGWGGEDAVHDTHFAQFYDYLNFYQKCVLYGFLF